MGQQQSISSSKASRRSFRTDTRQNSQSSYLELHEDTRNDTVSKQPQDALQKEESTHTLAPSEASSTSAFSSMSTLHQLKNNNISNHNGQDEEVQEFYLKKRRPNSLRIGLHWQEDPTGSTWLRNNMNWPRDFATIRGTVVSVKCKKWLLATHVKQVHSHKWQKAPKGAALPMFYGNMYLLMPHKQYVPKKDREPTTDNTTLLQESGETAA